MGEEEMRRMSGDARVGDMPIAVARKMCKRPMSKFEVQKAPTHIARTVLKPNEHWLPIVYVNTRYSVQLSQVRTDIGTVIHLWIRRHDGEMSRAWADLQRIKNEVVGVKRSAVEVFPPESELVDEANMTHLWVFPEDYVVPFRLGR
jgi:hypothetical protein